MLCFYLAFLFYLYQCLFLNAAAVRPAVQDLVIDSSVLIEIQVKEFKLYQHLQEKSGTGTVCQQT